MTGRPTKLDDVRAQKIIKTIREGGSQRCAAAIAGIAMSTLTDWLARGRRDEAPFAAFSVRFKEAAAEAEQVAVKVIRDAAKRGTWQAAAWWLERRFPEWRSPEAKVRAKLARSTLPPWTEPTSPEEAIARVKRTLAENPELAEAVMGDRMLAPTPPARGGN